MFGEAMATEVVAKKTMDFQHKTLKDT